MPTLCIIVEPEVLRPTALSKALIIDFLMAKRLTESGGLVESLI